MTALQFYEWLKSCPLPFWKDLRYEDGICFVHFKERSELYSKCLNLLLDPNNGPIIHTIKFVHHEWDSLDELNQSSEHIAIRYAFDNEAN